MNRHRAGDRFRFNPKLGRRLRELRKKAGFTQQRLAAAMGSECKGNHTVVSRLECGKTANPRIGLIADYLRACGTTFADILSELDKYTLQPTVEDVKTNSALTRACEGLPPRAKRAADRYDRRTVKHARYVHEPPPSPAERVGRARRLASSQDWAERVRRQVVRIIETRQLHVTTITESFLQSYAAGVWWALNRTRGKREPKRTALLDEAAKPFVGQGGPRHKDLETMKQDLLEFLSRLEAEGRLDEPRRRDAASVSAAAPKPARSPD